MISFIYILYEWCKSFVINFNVVLRCSLILVWRPKQPKSYNVPSSINTFLLMGLWGLWSNFSNTKVSNLDVWRLLVSVIPQSKYSTLQVLESLRGYIAGFGTGETGWASVQAWIAAGAAPLPVELALLEACRCLQMLWHAMALWVHWHIVIEAGHISHMYNLYTINIHQYHPIPAQWSPLESATPGYSWLHWFWVS